MQGKHFSRIRIDEGVNLCVRRVRFEHRKYGRTEQDVAVVPELDDEYAAHFIERDGVRNHCRILTHGFVQRHVRMHRRRAQ